MSFWDLLVGKLESPLNMMLKTLEVSWNSIVLLIILLLAFILVIGLTIDGVSNEGLAETVALPSRVLGVWVPWALLVEDLIETLSCVAGLLAARWALNCRDKIVSLALSAWTQVVLLALVVVATVVVAFPCVLVISAASWGTALLLQVLLVCPDLHHVIELHDGLGLISPEVPIQDPVIEAVMDAVDDVSLGDDGNMRMPDLLSGG
jgi:hypothetical protein